MPQASDPLQVPFAQALLRAGVDVEDLRAVAVQARSVSSLGVELLRRGRVTPEQLGEAQRIWAASAQSPAPPTHLGSYEIERRLGAGASGEVYLVRDAVTGARYAAKRLIDQGDPEERARFRREAEILAKLGHPHLAHVHAAEFEGPTPFFVLDYYSGGTLKDRLARGPLDAETIRSLLGKLSSALEAAHGVGVLHRDLKPENVLFDERGEPRVTDFGLALQLTEHSNRLTETGVILGTPSYMPPEQAQDGKRVDERSDVYGLGAILYHCLTGEAPFAGRGSLVSTLYAVIEESPPKPSALAAVDPGLERVCLRALEKDPARRYADASAFRQALTVPPNPSRTPTSLVLCSVAVLLGSLAALWWFSGETNSAQGPEETPLASRARGQETALKRVEASLERGQVREAWLELIEVGESPESLGLAIRVLEAAPSRQTFEPGDPDQEDLSSTWRSFWDLRASLRRVHELVFERMLAAQGGRALAYVALEDLVELCNRLSRRAGPWRRTLEVLLIQAVDLCDRAHHELRIAGNPYQSADLRFGPELPEAAIAQGVVERITYLRNPNSPSGRENSRNWLAEALSSLPPEWQVRWPPHLAAKYISRLPAAKRPSLRSQWVRSLRPPYPKGHTFPELCSYVAVVSLEEGGAMQPPDLVSIRELVRICDAIGHPEGAARLAVLDIVLGDLEQAQRRLDRLQIGEFTRLAKATLELERARRLAPRTRGPHLAAADELLPSPPGDRGTWAARKHLHLLAGDEGKTYPLPSNDWSSLPGPPITTPAVPWYRFYEPTQRFPDEGPAPHVWLPSLRKGS